MEVAVRRQELVTQRKSQLGAPALDADELNSEQRGQRSVRRRLKVARVYFPA
ncbi:MAG TPA: hypothetical protein VE736_02605 [Gaiellaceae bacterium]|nr:hypothetical protein [Gaiellaceae bacterium]